MEALRNHYNEGLDKYFTLLEQWQATGERNAAIHKEMEDRAKYNRAVDMTISDGSKSLLEAKLNKAFRIRTKLKRK